RAVYQIGQAAFADRVKLTWAAAPNSAQTPQWRALLALGETWTPPALPVSGVDAVAAGTPKGPLVGAVLREVEAWWIDQDFPDDRAAAAERLKAVVQGMVP
ncbi:MAG: CCA tRNA nucleotidyltransferase, partial [Phenylobacterium sp.]|nr:CCA tRNA nucleotidyltransferase [Phenylobacterium sp.]